MTQRVRDAPACADAVADAEGHVDAPKTRRL